jgi:hypothetical protein
VTAITRFFKPNAKRVSVMDGEVEMIRIADLLPLLPAQSEDAAKKKNRITAVKRAV